MAAAVNYLPHLHDTWLLQSTTFPYLHNTWLLESTTFPHLHDTWLLQSTAVHQFPISSIIVFTLV